jgi:hypothetical protein
MLTYAIQGCERLEAKKKPRRKRWNRILPDRTSHVLALGNIEDSITDLGSFADHSESSSSIYISLVSSNNLMSREVHVAG